MANVLFFDARPAQEKAWTKKLWVFDDEELIKRDKVNLDLFWLRDKSLEDGDDLPEPDVIAQGLRG